MNGLKLLEALWELMEANGSFLEANESCES